VVRAIASPSLAVYRQAWGNYQREAETRIDALPHDGDAYARAQIELILAKAQIWYEAGNLVRYLNEYNSATEYADHMGIEIPSDLVIQYQDPATSLATMAETLQAHGQYDEALDLYIAAEAGDLSNPERGHLNFRMAECYYGLLQEQGDEEELTRLLQGSLESALLYLEGMPTWAWAHRLLEESGLGLLPRASQARGFLFVANT
jgi:tetratricopeptide (TPR) repeat protein